MTIYILININCYRYKQLPVPVPTSAGITMSAPESTLSNWKTKRAPRTCHKDELEEFISITTIDVENPRLWWIQHKKDYPQLSRMALDILAIPAIPAEVEHVFSSTGLLITDR